MKLKIEYKILRHELKSTNLKLSLRTDSSKIESELRTENSNLRENLAKLTFEHETLKVDHEQLMKYSAIVKGELTQSKEQLEKLYSARERLDEHISIQKPTYDKTGIGYLCNMSAKKLETDLTNLEEKEKSNDKIESNQSLDEYKEAVDEQSKEAEKLYDPKQDDPPKETRYVFRGKGFSCNEFGHMKRDCKNNSIKHVIDFYCYNFHGNGHKAIDCKKPKFNNNDRNSRISTNLADNGRSNGERKKIICYRCNKLGHIARNCRTPEN